MSLADNSKLAHALRPPSHIQTLEHTDYWSDFLQSSNTAGRLHEHEHEHKSSHDDIRDSPVHVMKAFSRSLSGSPREVRVKAWKVDGPAEAPLLTLKVDSLMDTTTETPNGHFKEHAALDGQRDTPFRVASGRAGIFDPGHVSPAREASLSPWSSAVGHASTGKSGRVIERLQGDIDRLHRDKQLLQVRLEESEKANETLTTRNQYLQDRNSNYEQSNEANLQQLARKERQMDDLREELRREKARTGRAEQVARDASASEEVWRDEASQAKSIAVQKEAEYDTIAACRTLEHDRHQSGLDNLKDRFEALLRQREQDLETHKRLEIVAEQQRQSIGLLEELNKKLNTNFKAYRSEIDSAVSGLRASASIHDSAITTKLEEMTSTTNKMRWVMNVDREIIGNVPQGDNDSR